MLVDVALQHMYKLFYGIFWNNVSFFQSKLHEVIIIIINNNNDNNNNDKGTSEEKYKY